MQSPAYNLIDPRPIAGSAPYTFFLPTAREIAAVAKDDIVKLTFDYPHETETWAAERMWVTVEEVDAEDLRGFLSSHPDEPTSSLKAGDQITFQRHHILAIEWRHPKSAPGPAKCREYWERCLVDDCVLEGAEPVAFIYRETPDLASEGDTYPDSGWRIRGRVGSATDEEMDARSMSYVAIGAVLNKDDSWLDLIDDPIGQEILYDFEEKIWILQE